MGRRKSCSLTACWNRLPILGFSHQLLQYQSTSNRQLPGVEFYVDKFFAVEDMERARAIGAERQLLSRHQALAGKNQVSLSNLMENEEIRDALLHNKLDDVPGFLIQLANERGGDDNITVLAVERAE